MKIAIPTAEGQLAMHFGHCEKFTVFDVENGEIVKKTELDPPQHEPGVLPRFLHDKNVNVIIAGGMGMRAQQLFEAADIHVEVGAPADTPEELVRKHIDGELETGENVCSH